MTKSEIVNLWLKSVNRPDDTRRVYYGNINAFFDYLPDESILITESDVQGFKDYLIDTGHTNQTVCNYLSTVKMFSRWFAHNGGDDFARHINKPIRNKNLTETLTLNQLKRVIDATSNTRDKLIIIFMAYEGWGIKDIININWRDVKESKIYNEFEEEIKDYYKGRNILKDHDPFFVAESNNNKNGKMTVQTVSNMCKKALRDAGLDDPHLTAYSITLTYHKIQAMKEIAGMEFIYN